MSLFDQMFALDPSTLAVRAPRGPRNPETAAARIADRAPVAEATESFDADAHYLCLCGQVLVNWSCGVCDVRSTLKVAA